MNFTTNHGRRIRFSNTNANNPTGGSNDTANQSQKYLVKNSTTDVTDKNIVILNDPPSGNVLRDKQSILSRSIQIGMFYNIDKPGCISCRGAK